MSSSNEGSSAFSTDINISVAIDGIDVPQILGGAGLTAALIRCDPRTATHSQQPIPLSKAQFNPLVGKTECYVKPNATANPLGILLKFKSNITTTFAFERRVFVTLALFIGDDVAAGSHNTPIGITPPFFLSELMLARRHTRNTEIKWIIDPPPMNEKSKVKVTLVATEASGGGVDYVELQFRGEKMRKMDFFSQSDCFYRLRRVFKSAADAPPSVVAKSNYKKANESNDAKKKKNTVNAHRFDFNEVISEVYQSAVIDDCANPEWQPTDPILVSALTSPDFSEKCIEFACFDEDTFPKSDDDMGSFRVSMKDLLFAGQASVAAKPFELEMPSMSTKDKMKHFGSIFCTKAQITRLPSAMSLMSAGWRMKLTVAVDFSSMDAQSKTSIHYAADATDPRRNIVARIIAGAGDVLALYGSSTQSTPSLGLTRTSSGSGGSSDAVNDSAEAIGLYAFGATVAGAKPGSDGARNGGLLELASAAKSAQAAPTPQSSSMTCQLQAVSEQNVVSAVRRYAAAIPSLQPSPQAGRNFGPIVNTFAQIARESGQHKIYSVVVVIVDDDVSSEKDAYALNDALVAADDAPLSVLFVGVSQANAYKNLSAFEVVSDASKGGGGGGGGSAAVGRTRSLSMTGSAAIDEQELFDACVGRIAGAAGAASQYGGGVPLRHSVDNRRSRRTIAEFCRFFPRMAQMSRHDIAAEVLEGVPMHFMQYAAMHKLKA